MTQIWLPKRCLHLKTSKSRWRDFSLADHQNFFWSLRRCYWGQERVRLRCQLLGSRSKNLVRAKQVLTQQAKLQCTTLIQTSIWEPVKGKEWALSRKRQDLERGPSLGNRKSPTLPLEPERCLLQRTTPKPEDPWTLHSTRANTAQLWWTLHPNTLTTDFQ